MFRLNDKLFKTYGEVMEEAMKTHPELSDDALIDWVDYHTEEIGEDEFQDALADARFEMAMENAMCEI